MTKSEIFPAFICIHPDDYGLQLMKTPNSASQLEYYIKTVKIYIFNREMWAF